MLIRAGHRLEHLLSYRVVGQGSTLSKMKIRRYAERKICLFGEKAAGWSWSVVVPHFFPPASASRRRSSGFSRRAQAAQPKQGAKWCVGLPSFSFSLFTYGGRRGQWILKTSCRNYTGQGVRVPVRQRRAEDAMKSALVESILRWLRGGLLLLLHLRERRQADRRAPPQETDGLVRFGYLRSLQYCCIRYYCMCMCTTHNNAANTASTQFYGSFIEVDLQSKISHFFERENKQTANALPTYRESSQETKQNNVHCCAAVKNDVFR